MTKMNGVRTAPRADLRDRRFAHPLALSEVWIGEEWSRRGKAGPRVGGERRLVGEPSIVPLDLLQNAILDEQSSCYVPQHVKTALGGNAHGEL